MGAAAQRIHLLLRHIYGLPAKRGVNRPAHTVYQLFTVYGLEEVVKNGQFDRPARILKLIVPRDDDHLAIRHGLPHGFNHLQPITLGHTYVRKNDIRPCA